MRVALYQRGHDKPTEAGKPIGDPHAALEWALIAEFLAERGQTRTSLAALPGDEQQALLRAAASYANAQALGNRGTRAIRRGARRRLTTGVLLKPAAKMHASGRNSARQFGAFVTECSRPPRQPAMFLSP